MSPGSPPLPKWVDDLAGPPRFLATAGFDAAPGMDILTFQQRVVDAYGAAFAQLAGQRCQYPVRFWAFIPRIHEDLGAGIDRYKAFNAGRYHAYTSHFGQSTFAQGSVPTASAVGVAGDRFTLNCLAADEPGIAIENPRQVPAYRYSKRFGPMPPGFARATLVRPGTDRPVLFVGGTASITGEESRHVGDVPAQARETLLNLASVVASAEGRTIPDGAQPADLAPTLAKYHEIRIYYTRDDDRPMIVDVAGAAFSSARRVEMVQASLCRPELLVEIEGLAFPER